MIQRGCRATCEIKKGQYMTDIPNTEYITINKDDVFVGGKPAIKYRGVEIAWIEDLWEHFEAIQKMHPNIMEMHALSSETRGEYGVVGNPSAKHGYNAWCRVKFNNGRVSPWGFAGECDSMDECASLCAYKSLDNFRLSAKMRSAVLGTPDYMIEALQDVDLSTCVDKPVQLNGYRILVEKIAETQQIKR